MLLRLLPAPKPNQAAPPTILFTLPLVTAPYTSKSLPLPPNLLNHRSACAREGVECSNVLLGDKAAWIVGVIDEVTFSVRDSRITVSLVDGNNIILPIDNGCGGMLDGVIKQVHLSFANNTPTTPVSAPAPSSSMYRSASSGSSSGKRSPSALLSALLSPIMANVTPVAPAPAPINPSRLHRRQARSLLVDAFRRHVLPNLKEMLPANYMLWSLQGEMRVKRDEWSEIKSEVDRVLANAGHVAEQSIKKRPSYSSIGGSRDGFASSSSLNSDTSDSDSDADSTPPLTPATSVWGQGHSSRSSLTPLGHLSTLPACIALPASHRANYANLVSRLASLASRLTSIQKTIAAIEKEDGRKRWLESLEASRQLEKANRRAMSAMCGKQLTVTSSPFNTPFAPVRSSGLWQSYVAGDEEEGEEQSHPAMSMVTEEEEDDEMTDDDVFSPNIIVRPISPLGASSIFIPSVLQPAPSHGESLMPLPPRRTSLGDDLLMPPPSTEKLANRRPSIETMDLGNYRIVPVSAVDGDDSDQMLGHIAGAQLHDIPSKAGEAGFRVGVAIVR